MADQKTTAEWTGTALGVLSILATPAVGFGVYWWGRRSNRKALTYSYTSTKIVTTKPGVISGLKIQFEGREVSDASLVSITVKNSGGTPIEAKDFDRSLIFFLNEAAEILTTELPNEAENSLRVEIKSLPVKGGTNPSALIIEPLLLNPGDQFVLMALVSGFTGQVRAAGRISGVKNIQTNKGHETTAREGAIRIFTWGAVAMVILTPLIYLAHPYITDLMMQYMPFALLALLVAGAIFLNVSKPPR